MRGRSRREVARPLMPRRGGPAKRTAPTRRQAVHPSADLAPVLLFSGMPQDFRDVDPRELRLPSGRSGPDPYKLQRQIARFGASSAGMPPPWVYEASDGVLVLYNGVTRASRIAKLRRGRRSESRSSGNCDGPTPASPRSETLCHEPGDPARADREARRTPRALARCPVRPVIGQPRPPRRGPDRPVALGRRGRHPPRGHREAPCRLAPSPTGRSLTLRSSGPAARAADLWR